MRVVLDANILIRAAGNSRSPARSLLRIIARDPQHVLIVSPFVLQEVERTLSSPRGESRWKMSVDQVRRFSDLVSEIGQLVIPVGGGAYVPGDPDDNPILQLAFAGKADVLCTRDEDFKHPRVAESCGLRGLRVTDDVILLRELRTPDA